MKLLARLKELVCMQGSRHTSLTSDLQCGCDISRPGRGEGLFTRIGTDANVETCSIANDSPAITKAY